MHPQILQEYHSYLIGHPELVEALPTLRCATLSTILAEQCIDHVDWWVLDVEGMELDVVRGVKWDELTMSVIVVEADGRRPVKDAAVISTLTSAGFIYDGRIGRNDWFHHRSFEPSRGHATAPTNVYADKRDPSNTVKYVPQLPRGWAMFDVDGSHVYHLADPWQVTSVLPQIEDASTL